jgi:hypothetical protein
MKIAAKLFPFMLFPFMCAFALCATAAEPQLRPKDAAEAVQEGNVRNWVEYYERQRRENAPPKPAPPATGTPPATTEPPRERRQ